MEEIEKKAEIIESNTVDICKLIESKCMKPLEIKPFNLVPAENSADFFFLHGFHLRNKGDFDAAITQYRLGLRRNEWHEGLRINLGVCLMKIGLLSKALDLFKETPCMQAYVNSCICYISTNNYFEAITEIKKALSLSQNAAFSQLHALALFRSGKVSEALEVFRDVDPELSIIEDERNLRLVKNPKTMFPFKVGEITEFLSENRGKIKRNSRSSSQTSAQTTHRSSKSMNYSKVRAKVVHRCEKKVKKIEEFKYTPKIKPKLPSYEFIVEKKKELDRIVKNRHQSILELIQNKVPISVQDEFTQQKLETTTNPFYQGMFPSPDHKKKIEKIKKDLNKVKQVEFKEEYKVDDLITKRLSQQKLKLVDLEFSKEKSLRDYDFLGEILKKLPFFAKFPLHIREKLLKCAVFKQFKSDEVIIMQGEIGDSMFVILSGSIKILKASAEFGNLEVTINSMYDGETFGELALLSEGISDSIKRSATCVAGENTKLLAISKEDYKSILLYEMHNDIMGKVNFFQSLPFFATCSSISLIPLASNIEPVTYCIDDRVIELGEKPKGLYILYKGRCSLYWEGYVAKKCQPNLNTNVKIRPKTPRPFITGTSLPGLLESTIKRQKKAFLKSIEVSSEEFFKAKPYLTDNDIKGKYVAKEKILFKPLKEGDYFGGRALYDGILDVMNQSSFEQQVKFEVLEAKPAKFTVIAESCEVKMFIITRRHFPLLSEEILERLRIFLAKDHELDCPKQWSDEFLIQAFKEWHSYKQEFISQVENENYLAKHKGDNFN